MAGRQVAAGTVIERLIAEGRTPLTARIGRRSGPAAERRSPGDSWDAAADEAVAQLRRVVRRMQAALGETGSPPLTRRHVTLADLAARPSPEGQQRIRAHAAFDPAGQFGAPLVEQYPHLAWLEQARGGAEMAAPDSQAA